MRAFCLAGTLVFLGFFGCRSPAPPPEALRVGAASDLDPALREIAARFEQTAHVRILPNFGSTGTLARQIEQGAPLDMLMAADSTYVERLKKQNLVLSDSIAVYGRGRIVVVTRDDAPFRADRIEDLRNPEIKRVAVANPEHAPYGRAAEQALKSAGLHETVKDKLVLGENVSQAFQFVRGGNADVGIVAFSLVRKSSERFFEIPADLYAPLDQSLCIVSRTKRERDARAFAEFVLRGEGRDILRRYGFLGTEKRSD